VVKARRRVLVVEDDPSINEVVCTLLETEGYETICVSLLLEAREKIASFDPVCLIVDLNLPDGNAAELIDEVAHGPKPRNVVIMSASHRAADVARRFAVPLVKKPFDLSALLAAVDLAVERGLAPAAR
jgi:two-component system OmpR family response regulator